MVQDTANTLAAVEELLPLLHDMEGVTSGSTIAPLAEAVLEGVAKAGSPAVAETVKSLRSATASRRRELAARKRKETLAALGMQQVLYCLYCPPSTALTVQPAPGLYCMCPVMVMIFPRALLPMPLPSMNPLWS